MTYSNLIAFHGDPKIKEDLLAQLQLHYDADEMTQDKYWQWGNGGRCPVGCTIHYRDEKDYETDYGISQALECLKDSILSGLPNHLSKQWPLDFARAIPVGADLSLVWPKFAAWMLTDENYGAIQYAQSEDSKKAIQQTYHLCKQVAMGEEISVDEWNEVWSTYFSYFEVARFDAITANATVVDAATCAYYVVRHWAEEGGLTAPYDAAEAACRSCDREKIRVAQAEKLIQLLNECK